MRPTSFPLAPQALPVGSVTMTRRKHVTALEVAGTASIVVCLNLVAVPTSGPAAQ